MKWFTFEIEDFCTLMSIHASARPGNALMIFIRCLLMEKDAKPVNSLVAPQ